MKIDPTAFANIDRLDRKKANVIALVDTLPSIATEGDMVIMQGTLHVHLQGTWQNIDANLSAAIQTLTQRVKRLEDN